MSASCNDETPSPSLKFAKGEAAELGPIHMRHDLLDSQSVGSCECGVPSDRDEHSKPEAIPPRYSGRNSRGSTRCPQTWALQEEGGPPGRRCDKGRQHCVCVFPLELRNCGEKCLSPAKGGPMPNCEWRWRPPGQSQARRSDTLHAAVECCPRCTLSYVGSTHWFHHVRPGCGCRGPRDGTNPGQNGAQSGKSGNSFWRRQVETGPDHTRNLGLDSGGRECGLATQ